MESETVAWIVCFDPVYSEVHEPCCLTDSREPIEYCRMRVLWEHGKVMIDNHESKLYVDVGEIRVRQGDRRLFAAVRTEAQARNQYILFTLMRDTLANAKEAPAEDHENQSPPSDFEVSRGIMWFNGLNSLINMARKSGKDGEK